MRQALRSEKKNEYIKKNNRRQLFIFGKF